MSLVIKPSNFKHVLKRTYAAQASTAQQNYSLPYHQPQVTTLPNGAIVASLENNSPLSHIAILYKAGSRYETADNLGVSHVLRLCAGLGTKNITGFTITRSVQQLGGNLVCTSNRDTLGYSMSFIRNHLDEALPLLTEVSSRAAFKPWEVADLTSRTALECALRTPTIITLEMLHEAAFHNSGLGNSLYAPAHHIGHISPEQLASFESTTHLSSRVAMVGLGVEHETLMKQAKELSVGTGAGPSNSGQYFGGEIHKECGGTIAYVAVAGQGAPFYAPEAAALAVAQCILGTGPGTKYGSNSSSKLAKAAGPTAAVFGINASYSDSGLFGFFVAGESGNIQQTLSNVYKAVKTLKVTDADMKCAKHQAKVSLLMEFESGSNVLESMGNQALFLKKYDSPDTLASAIDAVTASSVQSVINKAFSGKLSMAAYGSIANVPYLDQF